MVRSASGWDERMEGVVAGDCGGRRVLLPICLWVRPARRCLLFSLATLCEHATEVPNKSPKVKWQLDGFSVSFACSMGKLPKLQCYGELPRTRCRVLLLTCN